MAGVLFRKDSVPGATNSGQVAIHYRDIPSLAGTTRGASPRSSPNTSANVPRSNVAAAIAYGSATDPAPDERTRLTVNGPMSWPRANAAVIAAINRGAECPA